MQSVLHYAMSPMTLKANRLEYIYACVGSVDFVAYLVFIRQCLFWCFIYSDVSISKVADCLKWFNGEAALLV